MPSQGFPLAGYGGDTEEANGRTECLAPVRRNEPNLTAVPMTDSTLSTALVVAWFALPQLVGIRFGWRGVVIATLVYAVAIPLGAIVLAPRSGLYLAGSPTLLPLMALFVVGLNVAIFALLKTIADLFRPKKDVAP